MTPGRQGSESTTLTMQSECMPWRTLARVQFSPSSGLIITPWPMVPVLTDAGHRMPGEGSTLGSNRYSPEQAELVEQRASAVSDTGERIVANRDREISLLV